MCARGRKPLIVLSIVLMAVIAAVWIMSHWRWAGWSRYDEAWVLPGSGMQELHTTQRLWWVVQGRFEASRTESLSAVIPAGSSAAGEARHESSWMWQPAGPMRVRLWTERWQVTRWNNWRFGDFGWYDTTGGGSASRVFSIPLWMVMAVVGTPCWLALGRAARTRRRRRRGQCVRCAYNRRGLPLDSACPECGAQAVT